MLSTRYSIGLPCLLFSTIINASPIPKPSDASSLYLHSRSIFENALITATTHASALARRSLSNSTENVIIGVVAVIGFLCALAFAGWIIFGTIHDIIWDPRKQTPVNMAKLWRKEARGKAVYRDHFGNFRLHDYNGDPRSLGPGMYPAREIGTEEDMRSLWLVHHPIDTSTSNSGGGG
jgi:hypothetical protein